MTSIERLKLSQLLEAAFFVSDTPLNIKQLKTELLVNYKVSHQEIRDVITELVIKYKDSGINLVKVASGYRFETITTLSDDLAFFVAKTKRVEYRQCRRELRSQPSTTCCP